MELLLLKVPSKLGVWTLEESLTMIKKIPKLWSWDLDAFKKEEKLIEEVVTNFEISDLFISSQSSLAAAAAAAAPGPAAGAVVFNHKAQFRMCWQTRLVGNVLPKPSTQPPKENTIIALCKRSFITFYSSPCKSLGQGRGVAEMCKTQMCRNRCRSPGGAKRRETKGENDQLLFERQNPTIDDLEEWPVESGNVC